MQKKTVVRIIAEIKANYRYTYRDMKDEELRILTERWYDCLKEFTDEQVEQAFRVALCKCSVPPTLADIIGIISRQEGLTEPRDMELWQTLIHAVGETCQTSWSERKGFQALWEIRGSGAKEIYIRLPIILREYCDFNSFCDMGGMTGEELRYERARFLKAILEIRESLRERRLAGIGINNLPRIDSAEISRELGDGKNELS